MSFLTDAVEKARRARFQKESASAVPRPVETDGPAVVFKKTETVHPTLSPRLRQLVQADGIWAEQFRALRERLRSLGGSEKLRRLGIVSATGSEGKTTIAITLSIILAEESANKVLLVDADLRHRDVDRYLGVEAHQGLSEWLQHPEREVETIRLADHGTYVVGAGHPSGQPWELITSPHLGRFLDAAGREFDYVLVDCPPQGPVSDTARIQEYLDGIILVVRARRAPRESILAALEQLDEKKIVGIVLNDVRRAFTNYYHYAYSHYRYR